MMLTESYDDEWIDDECDENDGIGEESSVVNESDQSRREQVIFYLSDLPDTNIY